MQKLSASRKIAHDAMCCNVKVLLLYVSFLVLLLRCTQYALFYLSLTLLLHGLHFFYRKWINCNFPLLFFVPQSDALDYEFTQNEIWIYRWNSHLLYPSLWWISISIFSEPWGVIILNVHIIIIAIKHYNLINICWIVLYFMQVRERKFIFDKFHSRV